MKKLLVLIICGISILSTVALASCGEKGFNKDSKITCYTRDTTSGTRDGFFSKIGLKSATSDNGPLVEGTLEAKSNDEMITKIKNDEYGIGYISLASYDSKVVKGLTYQNVVPSEANVLNGTYGLTRNFNYMTRASYDDEKVGKIIEAFLAFLGTKDAKTTIKGEDGIIEIKSTDPTWDSIKDNYPITKEDNSSVTVKFGGSTSCQKIAEALSAEFSAKCGNFVAQHAHTGSGDAYKRVQGSESKGTNAIDFGYASREFNISGSEPAAEGTYAKMCIDAIVAVVNVKNPLEKITSEMLVKMYTGSVTTWSKVLE